MSSKESSAAIPPLIRLLPNRVWRSYLGGKLLDQLEGKVDADDSHFPEDWVCSTTAAINPGRNESVNEGISRVALGEKEISLKNLLQKFPAEILGPTHFAKYGSEAQFLVKLLDSNIRLHIQAHPTLQFAKKHLNSNSGKTEAYVILGVRKEISEPYIYLGFQHAPSKGRFREIVLKQETSELLSCFEKVPVHAGDVFLIPGGMPHAIGEGIFMIEIMEPTDFVVRLEFERGGYILPEPSRFMGRDVNFAIEMIDFTQTSGEDVRRKHFCPPRITRSGKGGIEYILIDEKQTRCFEVLQLDVTNKFRRRSDSFHVGIVKSGIGSMAAGGHREGLKLGDRFLIPFSTKEVEYKTDEGMKMIFAYPPK
ncbi:MAG TPA: class I mannose-6-phosphate isomerase [Candidatus Kryptonia bacterium]